MADNGFKPVSVRVQLWQQIRDLTVELEQERNAPVSMAQVIGEAIAVFMRSRQQ